MTMNVFGVHVVMVMHLAVVAWPLWVAQILVAVFFTSGFIGHYQDLYDYAFSAERTAGKRWAARIGLMVMSIGVGMTLHLMGYVVGNNTVMFHNVGLFLVLFPLLDSGISWWEVAIRAGALLSVWMMHHSQALSSPQYDLSLLLLVIGFVVMRRYRVYIRKTLWASIGMFAYAGIIFWALLPAFSAPSDRLFIMIRSIIMFIAIAGMAAMLWIREHNADMKNARLRKLANYDQLTNAKTYSLYQRDLTHWFDTTRAAGQPLSLVALDIDHFKQINDHYGHLAGNAVLIGVATTLSEVLARFGDSHQIYRTGGEEFNIVFPDKKPDAVVSIITACWEAVRKSHYTYENFDIAVTLSMGMTAVRPEDTSIDDTYKRADDNLYLSKHAGRDTITVEGETVYSRNDQDMIATYSYFTQGIMQVTTGQPHRYRNELLLRLFDHEHDRWVLPDMFDISVETQISLIQKALAMTSIRRLAVNLTTAQFSDEAVAEKLSAFATSKQGPDELTVEITDVPDILTTRQITAIYRAHGVRIDIDDVGSDNSYEVVHDLLPYVDGVKFAMQNLRHDNPTKLMRERIAFWVKVAKQTHLDFILEGVENAEEVAYAKDQLGVEFFQGYYYSKPSLPDIQR
ncbi:diguanylate cyclase domain-containing protein [Lacticaseibacillus sp. N501-2]|uniref:diguanylate cyclase domain-containing protein n=1 Tax=Lacticaseibacillus salsurae TaxID=3367729 RepID=UPI0038B2B7AA